MTLVNKHRIVGDLAYIELTKGQETVIDVVDLEHALTLRWSSKPHVMGGYYVMSRHKSRTIYLHRFVLNAPQGVYVDHINHDTLDNRRSNLRLCTNQENNANRDGAFTSSKTGIRGVSVHKHAPNKGTRRHAHASPDSKMYVFRCHCVTCKATKYFPYTEEGLESARIFAEAHYAAMKQRRIYQAV